MNFHQKLLRIKNLFDWLKKLDERLESNSILSVQPLIRQLKNKPISSLAEVEFKVFSQWGDDGIIQWLIQNIDVDNKNFIEFGVEDYIESNTRFLLMNNNWSGLIFDGSDKNIKRIKNSYYYWKYDLNAEAVFIDADNINKLIVSKFENNVCLLHIDIDGNDYWIWKAIDKIAPTIVIVEYNSLFGKDRAITIPYNKDFICSNAHYSRLYFGASIKALNFLAREKGYRFIGCNSAGNNAYFIRQDLVNNIVTEISVEEGYVASKFRQSRDKHGRLTYLPFEEAYQLIKGLPVYNVAADINENL